MDIAESIYDDSLEPSYKKPTIEDNTLAVQAVKIEENPPCQKLTM